MVLLQYNETKAETLSIFAPYPQQMIKRYLLLAFLEHQEKQLQFVRCLPDFFYQGKMSEKLEIIAKEWGWDPITLALAKQLKLEPSILQEHQEYLQHFRNIFKFLYEQGAFDVQNNRSVQAMDTWIYHQWDLLVEKYKKYQES